MNNNLNGANMFDGTAQYYAKYRQDYSQKLVDTIMNEVANKEFDRMLDIGCGTGKVALAFYRYFKEVIASDINQDMLDEGIIQGNKLGANNIKWILKASEDIDESLGKFDLITCGAAFHWMDRKKVSEICYHLLPQKGIFAIISEGGMNVHRGTDFGDIVQDKIEKWALIEKKEVVKSLDADIEKTHMEILKESSFKNVKEGKFEYKGGMDVETIIGYLYSTSYCSKKLFGQNIDNFEKDLRQVLYEINPDGFFEQTIEADYILCKKQ